jgi:hypothetical protein
MILRAAAAGLAVVTAVGGVLVAAGRVPVPIVQAATVAAPSRLVLPAAVAAPTCPGPETSIAPAGSSPQPPAGPITLTAAAAGTEAAQAAFAALTAPPSSPAAVPALGGADLRALERVDDVRGPVRLATPAAGPGATRLSAVQTTLARDGARRGLAVAACPPAATEAWLVGGGTTTGRRARLLLLDPTPAPAVVDVVVLGPRGPVDLPQTRGLVVSPGGARAIQLDALAPGLDRLAVHVVARRGRIAAVLDDSGLDGATAAGVDDVPIAAPPSRHVTVPGVVVPSVAAGGSAAATVRLATPGAEDAVVHLRLAGPAGEVRLPGDGVVTVPARSVVDVPLTRIAAGAYAVLADADVPVVAGAVVRVAGPPSGPLRRSAADIGWVAATSALQEETLVALPRPFDAGAGGYRRAAGGTRLALTGGDGAAAVVVRQVGTRGEVLRQAVVQVPAHATLAVSLGADAAALVVRVAPGLRVWAGVAVQVAQAYGALLALLAVAPPVTADRDAPVAVADPWLQVQSSQSSSP